MEREKSEKISNQKVLTRRLTDWIIDRSIDRSDYRIESASSSSSSTHRKVAEAFDETIKNFLEFLARDDHRLAIRRFRRPLAEEFNLGILGKKRVERIGAPGGEKRFAVENGFDRFRHRARTGSHDTISFTSFTSFTSLVTRVCARRPVSCVRACRKKSFRFTAVLG
jgi:hypothetical protein